MIGISGRVKPAGANINIVFKIVTHDWFCSQSWCFPSLTNILLRITLSSSLAESWILITLQLPNHKRLSIPHPHWPDYIIIPTLLSTNAPSEKIINLNFYYTIPSQRKIFVPKNSSKSKLNKTILTRNNNNYIYNLFYLLTQSRR